MYSMFCHPVMLIAGNVAPKTCWRPNKAHTSLTWFPPLSSALWFHNTLALQFGVGVNVFWRHLPANSYDQKDPYGNKDPVAATRALQALEKALCALDQLPEDYRDFYGRRMVQRVQKRTYCDDPSSTITQDTLLR